MSHAEEKRRPRRISVWNWLGTLLLCAIPGVNLVASILFIFFAKTATKRNFAIAMTILLLILAALTCVAFLVFTDQMAQLADEIRNSVKTQQYADLEQAAQAVQSMLP